LNDGRGGGALLLTNGGNLCLSVHGGQRERAGEGGLGERKGALEMGRNVSYLLLASERQRARWRWQQWRS